MTSMKKESIFDFQSDTIQEIKSVQQSALSQTAVPAPFQLNKGQVAQGGSSKELIMHCLMYGTSLYSELSEFRDQSSNNSYKVAYYSGAVTQIQLFMEFLFEVLHERGEPLVFAFEVVKGLLKLREYRRLVKYERVNVFIDMEQYKQLKQAQEYEDSICKLIRSQKQVAKPPLNNTVVSNGLQNLRKSAIKAKTRELKQIEDAKSPQEKQKRKSGGFFAFIKEIFKLFGNMLLNSKFSIDELINIVRPVIYVYAILKFGRRSFRPIKISLALDVIQVIFSILRIWRSHKERRKIDREGQQDGHHKRPLASQSPLFRSPLSSSLPETDLQSAHVPFRKMHFILRNIEVHELQRRIFQAFFKYLVRDPIFEAYTKPMMLKVLSKMRIPQTIITYLFAFINYQRYYTWIA